VMMSNVEPSTDYRPSKRLNAEDIVIVVIIVTTLLLALISTALWFLEDPILIPPPIIAIFLGIAVAAVLYRFLGGVSDATFKVGALRVTGAAAILIFVAWWADGKLEANKPMPAVVPFDLTKHSIPEVATWFAVDKETGRPIKVTFPPFNQTHEPPQMAEINGKRRKNVLALNKEGELIIVKSNESEGRVLGSVDVNEINKLDFYDTFSLQLKSYRVVSFGPNDKVDINKDLPFILESRGFYDNYSNIYVIDKTTNEDVKELNMYLREAKVIEFLNRYYLISVVQVNHESSSVDPYAKIYVAEILVSHDDKL
ncbi:hypothetical protein CAG63_21665, partial [Vibrio sp. V37_P2S8PM304]|uniref:hypothetical protein n=2 Tax=Vibrio TaxID=662 RepID=UPI001372864B